MFNITVLTRISKGKPNREMVARRIPSHLHDFILSLFYGTHAIFPPRHIWHLPSKVEMDNCIQKASEESSLTMLAALISYMSVFSGNED